MVEYVKERVEKDAFDDFRLISLFQIDRDYELNIVTYGPMNDQIPI